MCGIIANFRTDNKIPTGTDKKKKKKEILSKIEPVNEFIVNQFQNQIDRGTKGFGLIIIDKDLKVVIKRATTEAKFLLDIYMNKANMMIAHHRMPTSTDNKLDQTHPILVENKILKKKYLIVHNGIISNCKDLKEKHKALGFEYTTEYEEFAYPAATIGTTKFNDTESLAIEIALFIEKKTKSIGTTNSAAFIVLQLNSDNIAEKIYFGRKNGMLRMAKTRNELKLSSEGPGNDIKDEILYNFELKDKQMALKSQKLIFEKYEKPKIIIPTKTEFAAGTGSTLNLPFTSTIGQQTKGRTHLDGSEHLLICGCALCKAARIKEEEDAIDEATIKETYITTTQNNIVQTEEIDIYDEKFVDQEITVFKDRIENKTSDEIQEIIDETLEELADKISTVVLEYKDKLIYETEIKNELNYITQIQIFMEAMKQVTIEGQKAYEEKTDEEKEIEEYNKPYNIHKTIDDEMDYEGNVRNGCFRYGGTNKYEENHKKIIGFSAH